MKRTSRQVERRADRLAWKAARSAVVQRRCGSRESVRALYYTAHSLLRTLRHHLASDAA